MQPALGLCRELEKWLIVVGLRVFCCYTACDSFRVYPRSSA